MTVKEMYADYAATVLPPDCSRIQRVETKRAFYAGVMAMLTECARLAGEYTEAGGAAMLGRMSGELDQFYDDMKAGKV